MDKPALSDIRTCLEAPCCWRMEHVWVSMLVQELGWGLPVWVWPSGTEDRPRCLCCGRQTGRGDVYRRVEAVLLREVQVTDGQTAADRCPVPGWRLWVRFCAARPGGLSEAGPCFLLLSAVHNLQKSVHPQLSSWDLLRVLHEVKVSVTALHHHQPVASNLKYSYFAFLVSIKLETWRKL